jgi:hypothetical protein
MGSALKACAMLTVLLPLQLVADVVVDAQSCVVAE